MHNLAFTRVPQRSMTWMSNITAKDSASRTTATAAAPALIVAFQHAIHWTAAISVLNGMLPEMSTTEPNSPTARANPSALPERIAGAGQAG